MTASPLDAVQLTPMVEAVDMSAVSSVGAAGLAAAIGPGGACPGGALASGGRPPAGAAAGVSDAHADVGAAPSPLDELVPASSTGETAKRGGVPHARPENVCVVEGGEPGEPLSTETA